MYVGITWNDGVRLGQFVVAHAIEYEQECFPYL